MKKIEMSIVLIVLVVLANGLEFLIYKFTRSRISSPSFIAGMLWIMYGNWKEKQ